MRVVPHIHRNCKHSALIAGVKKSPFSSLLAATYIDPPRRGRRENVVSNLIILREDIPEEEGEEEGDK